MENRIFHIDMDSFFPSVEALDNPIYAREPAVVGHQVVSSANYVARKLGIRSAMNLVDAKKICPKLHIIPVHFDKYQKISNKIFSFLSSISKTIEIGSIDEWYLDVSNTSYDNWKEQELASYIKESIKSKFNLSCTIGNSFTTFLSKMATNLAKPDGYLTLNKNNFKDYIYDLHISKIIGIGPNTTKQLTNLGINYIKDIANLNNDFLIRKKLGISWTKLKMNVTGIPCSFINPHHIRKNLGRSQSIRHFSEYVEFVKLLKELVDDINQNLKWDNYIFNSINVKIKYNNNDSATKSHNFGNFINVVPLHIVLNLLEQIIDTNRYSEVINISVTTNNIRVNDDKEQLTIFNSSTQKIVLDNKLEKIRKTVNKQLNKNIIHYASRHYK